MFSCARIKPNKISINIVWSNEPPSSVRNSFVCFRNLLVGHGAEDSRGDQDEDDEEFPSNGESPRGLFGLFVVSSVERFLWISAALMAFVGLPFSRE